MAYRGAITAILSILMSFWRDLLEACPGSTTNTELDALREFPSVSLPLALLAVSDSRGWQEFWNKMNIVSKGVQSA